MVIAGKNPVKNKDGNGRKKTVSKDLPTPGISTPPEGVIYSKRFNHCPFSAPKLKD